jgi:isoquinoline 1-oxidoreductase beta subunit
MYFRQTDIEQVAARGGGTPAELTRRQFLKLTTVAGSGLTLGIVLPGCGRGPLGGAGVAGSTSHPLAIPFVRVAPDNTVTVICKHVEAGQGVWTGLPAIVAEELDASWEQMRVESAPAEVPAYQNMAFVPLGVHAQFTGGSTAVANSWEQLRHAGATARAMLVAAAAQEWRVPPGEIIVSEGVLSHAAAGRQATFGELAGSAARQAVPATVRLKDPAGFRIVGREKLPRLDSRDKSTGKQQFAIDVKLPGMMTAVVMRPPRFGGKVSSFDATRAKAVPAWSMWCRFRAASRSLAATCGRRAKGARRSASPGTSPRRRSAARPSS